LLGLSLLLALADFAYICVTATTEELQELSRMKKQTESNDTRPAAIVEIKKWGGHFGPRKKKRGQPGT